jgi:hypothetical protein
MAHPPNGYAAGPLWFYCVYPHGLRLVLVRDGQDRIRGYTEPEMDPRALAEKLSDACAQLQRAHPGEFGPVPAECLRFLEDAAVKSSYAGRAKASRKEFRDEALEHLSGEPEDEVPAGIALIRGNRRTDGR